MPKVESQPFAPNIPCLPIVDIEPRALACHGIVLMATGTTSTSQGCMAFANNINSGIHV